MKIIGFYVGFVFLEMSSKGISTNEKSPFHKDMSFLFPGIEFHVIEECLTKTVSKTGYTNFQVSRVVLISSFSDYLYDILDFFGDRQERVNIINYLISRITRLVNSGEDNALYFEIPSCKEDYLTSFSEEFETNYLSRSEKIVSLGDQLENNAVLYRLLLGDFLEDLELGEIVYENYQNTSTSVAMRPRRNSPPYGGELSKKYSIEKMATRLHTLYKLIGFPKEFEWCKKKVSEFPQFITKVECFYELKLSDHPKASTVYGTKWEEHSGKVFFNTKKVQERIAKSKNLDR